jgi:gas vesicle protein
MPENMMHKVNYLLVGLGIGSVFGVLFAPKSCQETREYLAKKTREEIDCARKKASELRIHAEETVERGKERIMETKGHIAAAIDEGRKTYQREKLKTQVQIN